MLFFIEKLEQIFGGRAGLSSWQMRCQRDCLRRTCPWWPWTYGCDVTEKCATKEFDRGQRCAVGAAEALRMTTVTWPRHAADGKSGRSAGGPLVIQMTLINSLRPFDTIWWQGSGSTLVQVMACCLMAPSHCLNQCWLIIGMVKSSDTPLRISQEIPQTSVTEISLKITCILLSQVLMS